MGSKSGGGDNLNNWREYFRTPNSDIFDIIEHAIMVAASDCPKEFRLRRDRIAELLFNSRMTHCSGCDRVELMVPRVDDEGDDQRFKIKGGEFDDHGCVVSKGSNVNSCTRDDHGEVGGNMNSNSNLMNHPEINCSYGDAEALTDKIEEEKETMNEVLRIKDLLVKAQDESDLVLFESLRRLQLMALTVDILKATEIGKAVNGIRRHSSKQIRNLARSLIDAWKVIVDEWVKATQDIAEGGTPDSVNPSTVDEEDGLPSPPLDEGAFFSTQTMELSQFFDGMDDDGNPRNCEEFNKNRGMRRKPNVVKPEAPKHREEPLKEATPLTKDNKVPPMKKQEPFMKPNRPLNIQSGPGRPLNKVNGESNVCNGPKIQQKPEKPVSQRRPAPQAEELRSSKEDIAQDKLEATKRRLQERYQQAENAKRQRTIQVMELHDIPRQGGVNKNNMHNKFGNHNRNFVNARR